MPDALTEAYVPAPGGGVPALRYRRRHLRCEVPPADRARLVEAVDGLPPAMNGQFHNLNIKPITNVRQRGLYRLRVGDYRVIFWPVGDEIVVLEIDRKDDTAYTHLDRLIVHRHGEGVQVTELPEAPPEPIREVAGRASTRRAAPAERENPLTVFTTPQLHHAGLASDQIGEIRGLAGSVEIGEALASLDVSPSAS